jgi:hypothetical protein
MEIKHCTNCGNQMTADAKFCTSCGATTTTAADKVATVATPAQTAAPTATAAAASATFAQAPVRPQAQSANATTPAQAAAYREEPISTGGYFGILFLLAIPALNLLLLMIWACGGCRKVNKRNFARAVLLWCVIGGILSLLIVLVGGLLFENEWNALKESIIGWGGITK